MSSLTHITWGRSIQFAHHREQW